MYAAAGEEGDDLTSGSDAESGSRDAAQLRQFSLQLGGSVYDDAFLAPLVGSYGQSGERHVPYRCAWWLLLLALLLQVSVIYKVGGPNGLIEEAYSGFDKMLFEPGEEVEDGLCIYDSFGGQEYNSSLFTMMADPKDFPDGLKRPQPRAEYIHCQMTEVTALTDFDYLDHDSDGLWSYKEALDQEQRYLEAYGQDAQLGTIHSNICKFLRQYARAAINSGMIWTNGSATRQAHAILHSLDAANGAIPRDVFASQVEPFYKICLVMQDKLCGNAVYRRALDLSAFLEPLRRQGFDGAPLAFVANDFDHDGGQATNMVHVCEVGVREVCPKFLTNDFVAVQAAFSESCGQTEVTARDMQVDNSTGEKKVLTVEHEAAAKFRSTVLTPTYKSFLALILILWAISMLEELHAILIWWRVLTGFLFSKLNEPPSAECIVCEEDAIEIQHVPPFHCLLTMLVNLLPRTVIGLVTTWLGTVYLMSATSYGALVMDSLALTFLITIDDMVYAAFVPSIRRERIDKCKPLAPPVSACFDRAVGCVLNELVLFLTVCAFVLGALVFAYRTPIFGNEDRADLVTCMCEAAGPKCFTAWALGGYESVHAVPGAEG